MSGLEDKIYTVDEAADYLRWTRRGVIKVAKRHSLCIVSGRLITFTRQHILGIIEAQRPDPKAMVGNRASPAVQYSRLYELAAKAKLDRQARKEADRIRNAAARQEGRELTAELRRQHAAQKRDAKASQQPSAPEPLDHTNRDPNYWTVARKRQLRAEREPKSS
ncbi:hypothetical protein EN873_24365 [bacterium M00.F.Ca.ET.230.01.1.1]|nr:hypothetical protein EN873_24365 [bacterium M00.F.Ca.ET.230.01.1.1]